MKAGQRGLSLALSHLLAVFAHMLLGATKDHCSGCLQHLRLLPIGRGEAELYCPQPSQSNAVLPAVQCPNLQRLSSILFHAHSPSSTPLHTCAASCSQSQLSYMPEYSRKLLSTGAAPSLPVCKVILSAHRLSAPCIRSYAASR